MKYVIEHMESSVSEWVECEYTRIVQTCGAENVIFSKYTQAHKNTAYIDDSYICMLKH